MALLRRLVGRRMLHKFIHSISRRVTKKSQTKRQSY